MKNLGQQPLDYRWLIAAFSRSCGDSDSKDSSTIEPAWYSDACLCIAMARNHRSRSGLPVELRDADQRKQL